MQNRAILLQYDRPLRGYKFKETKHSRFGKRPAAIEAEEINDRSTEADVNALRRLIELVFFLFFYECLKILDLRFVVLDVASQAFTWKISIRSAKSMTFFAARLADSSLRGELACGPLIEVLDRICSWLNRKSSALPSAGASCAGSKVGAENFAWARNPTRYGSHNQKRSHSYTPWEGSLIVWQ